MKIALIEGPEGGHPRRAEALRAELESRGHAVTRFEVTAADLAEAERDRFALRHRLRRRLTGAASLPHAWDLLAHVFRRRLKGLAVDVVVARGTVAAHVAFQSGRPLVVDVDRVTTLEMANRWHVDARDLETTSLLEAGVLARTTLVVVPHHDVAQLLLEAFPRVEGVAARLVEAPNGLQPRGGPDVTREGLVVVATPVVHTDDPLLQASLATRLKGRLRRLGDPGPALEFLPDLPPALEPGEAVSLGLVTNLSDRLSRLRCWRVGEMLEQGIPVLAPRWVSIDPVLEPAVTRYEEESFDADLAAALEPQAFTRLSAAARAVQSQRSWSVSLAPLVERLESW